MSKERMKALSKVKHAWALFVFWVLLSSSASALPATGTRRQQAVCRLRLQGAASDAKLIDSMPTVLNVALGFSRSGWDSAVVAFGGATRVTVSRGLFQGNTADSTLVAFQEAAVIVQDNTVAEYNNGTSGSSIMALDSAKVVVRDAVLRYNGAIRSGAVSCSHNASVNVEGCVFHNNAANEGGAVEIACTGGHQAMIRNTTFTSNYAAYGGAVYILAHVKATLSNNTFSANQADTSGAAVYLAYQSSTHVHDCSFSANNAKYGAGMYCDSCRVQVANAVFTINTAVEAGGGLNVNGRAKAAINDTTFSANSAAYGGGVYLAAGGILGLHNSSYIANQASTSGGGIFLSRNSTTSARNCALHRNDASAGGGASCEGCTLQAGRLSFTWNSAVERGGALYADAQAQVFTGRGCSFVRNSAYWGGAVYLRSSANLTLSNSTLRNNSAAMAGGALLLTKSAVALVITGNILRNTASNGGGVATFGSELIIAGTKVQGNAADRGGGMYAAELGKVFILNNSIVSQNRASIGGGLSLNNNATGSLNGCKVISNTAERGGGVHSVDDTLLVLGNCLIANNSASSYGGGIRTEGKARLVLQGSTTVTRNRADDGWGGGVSLFSRKFDIDQVIHAVHNNSGLYDVDVQVRMTSLSLVGDDSILGFANRVGKGEGLVHVVVNGSGYHGLPCQGLQVQATLNKTVLGLGVFDQHGLAYMSFKVFEPPGVYRISFSSPGSPDTPAANLTLQTRGCVRGEVTPSPDTCQPCQQGFFSFDPSQEVCTACPGNANCTGGDVIIPNRGYWRSSADSTQIHRCPNPDACDCTDEAALLACAADPTCGTSARYKDLQCAANFYGNLCGLCSAGTAAVKLFVCRECMRTAQIVALYVLAALIMLGFIKLLRHLTLKQGAAASCDSDEAHKMPAAQLLRPLVLYSQYMLIVCSMPVDWPASISYPLKVLAWAWSPASPETLSIDCLLSRDGHLPMSIQKVLFYVCMPLVLLVLLLLVEVAQAHIMRARGKHVVMNVKDRLHSSTLVAVFFFLPSVLRTLFSMFACISIDQPAMTPDAPAAIGSYWVLDMNQQCFKGYHRAWSLVFGLPCILVVCLGVPTTVLFLMLAKQSKLTDDSTRQHYGFLYMSYRQPVFYWECFVIVQTMVLVAVSVFGVNLGVFYQVVVMNAALMLMVVLLLIFKPYEYPQASRIMLQAVSCLLLTSYTSLTFLQLGSVQPSSTYGIIMGTVVLLVNLVFLVYLLWQMLRLINWQRVRSLVQRTCSKVACGHFPVSRLVELGVQQKPVLEAGSTA